MVGIKLNLTHPPPDKSSKQYVGAIPVDHPNFPLGYRLLVMLAESTKSCPTMGVQESKGSLLLVSVREPYGTKIVWPKDRRILMWMHQ